VWTGPLQAEALPIAARIHATGLGYSFNGRLGADHVAWLLKTVAQDPNSTVVCAAVDRIPAGVVTATLDPDALRRTLRAHMGPRWYVRTALRMVHDPMLLAELIESMVVERPVSFDNRSIAACLTSIAVDGQFHRRGVGRALVTAVEEFFASRGCAAYRLDTRADNLTARRFYARLGFVECGRRLRSIVLVKVIARPGVGDVTSIVRQLVQPTASHGASVE
jgi:ribosomal protein S18 acetylase RimI-like enzyme